MLLPSELPAPHEVRKRPELAALTVLDFAIESATHAIDVAHPGGTWTCQANIPEHPNTRDCLNAHLITITALELQEAVDRYRRPAADPDAYDKETRMTELSIPSLDMCLENPDLAPIAILEYAIENACHALTAGRSVPDLDQEWIPSWRLPRNGRGWTSYWVLSAATGLQEALNAYRHSLAPHGQHQLLPDPQADTDCPF